MDSGRPRTRHDLVHPIPQHRYAFIFAHDSANAEDTPPGSIRPYSVPWAMDGLTRPVSAPAGFPPELPALERPSSPLSRVANPMVRDHHFRRGVAAADSFYHHPHPHPPHPHRHLQHHAHNHHPAALRPVAVKPVHVRAQVNRTSD